MQNNSSLKKFTIIRNLALLDILLHGKKIMLVEFIFSCIVGFTLGIYIYIFSQGSLWVDLLGLAIFGIGFNYLFLSLYAVKFRNLKKDEQFHSHLLRVYKSSKKIYIVLALFLIVPYVVGVMALVQESAKV